MARPGSERRPLLGLLLLLAPAVAGCDLARPPAGPPAGPPGPSPTVNALFGGAPGASLGPEALFGSQTAPAVPSRAPTLPPPLVEVLVQGPTPPPPAATGGPGADGPSDPAATPVRPGELITATVFAEQLNEDWTLFNSYGMAFEEIISPPSAIHSGGRALRVTPEEDFGELFFTLKQSAAEEYPRDEVLALRFWLYSAEDFEDLEDLAVTVIGSNDYPYWVEGDESVTSDLVPVFSETRLYFLDFNEAIPPSTWAEVTLWLDDLVFDPDYAYVTGFYLKNDKGFLQDIVLDDVALLLRPADPDREAGASATAGGRP
jgi:hypothetical protein